MLSCKRVCYQNVKNSIIRSSGNILHKPTLSLFSLQKAKELINNFAENACIHYGVSSNDFYKKHIDDLMYFTAIYYECDEKNEFEIQNGIFNETDIYNNNDLLTISDDEFNKVINNNISINDMILFLKDFKCVNGTMVESEIKDAMLYWKLEKFLCNDDNWNNDKYKLMINENIIQKCMNYRVFYFNIMNLIFCKLQNKDINSDFKNNLKFLTLHENMNAINDDVIDYNFDLKYTAFNIYIMYKKLYKNNIQNAKKEIRKYILKIEEQYQIEKLNIDNSIIKIYENGFKNDYNKNIINKQFNYNL